MIPFALRYWKILTVALLLLLVTVAVLAQRALVHYGDDRVRVALRPWQDAQTAWKAVRATDDKTNRDHNALLRKGYEADLANIADRLGGVQRMLDDTRDRGRRIEEAYRRYRLDAADRITAGEADLADFFGRVEAARGRVDSTSVAYDGACQRDAVRFTGLQDQVRPWVKVE